jgi:hypothetical protein
MKDLYTVRVIASDGGTVTQTEESTLRKAKRSALEKLAEPHRDPVKVEVLTAGAIVWQRGGSIPKALARAEKNYKPRGQVRRIRI